VEDDPVMHLIYIHLLAVFTWVISAFGNVLTGTHNGSCMDQLNTVLELNELDLSIVPVLITIYDS